MKDGREKETKEEKPSLEKGLWESSRRTMAANAGSVAVATVGDMTMAELRVNLDDETYSIVFESRDGIEGLGNGGTLVVEDTNKRRKGYPIDYEYSHSINAGAADYGYRSGAINTMPLEEAIEIVKKIAKGDTEVEVLYPILEKDEGDITLEEAIKNEKAKGFESR